MVIQVLSLAVSLLIILAAAELFTNGVEAFGRHFSFSQAVVGSIFAAVGTALPETILPIVAIFMYGGASASDIGVGAILGAPFMLSTLAFFLVGLTVAISSMRRRRSFELKVEIPSLKRDLTFFLAMYSSAIILPLVVGRRLHAVIAVALILGYFFYAWQTFRGESADLEHSGEMYFWKGLTRALPVFRHRPAPLTAILFQIIFALGVMVEGAHSFVGSLETISLAFGMNPLLFSLLLAPFATELPEKFNSVTWTWKGRDTLALGNITGAMVFQATFPVSVGLLFTPWEITGMALVSAALAILSSLAMLVATILKKRVPPALLLFSGCLYLVYAFLAVFR